MDKWCKGVCALLYGYFKVIKSILILFHHRITASAPMFQKVTKVGAANILMRITFSQLQKTLLSHQWSLPPSLHPLQLLVKGSIIIQETHFCDRKSEPCRRKFHHSLLLLKFRTLCIDLSVFFRRFQSTSHCLGPVFFSLQ